jgi:hypothetical protein
MHISVCPRLLPVNGTGSGFRVSGLGVCIYTCFTSTNVQILTPDVACSAMRVPRSSLYRAASWYRFSAAACPIAL